jgi:hypothetical protein
VAKWVAVGLGLGIIILAALLPDTIKNLGKVKPGAASEQSAASAEATSGDGQSDARDGQGPDAVDRPAPVRAAAVPDAGAAVAPRPASATRPAQ